MADVSTYKVYGTLPTIGEEQVKKLIEQSESGALPEVTADDNGKVLTVVNGEWGKADSGGGGGVFVVNFEEVEQGKLSADKTFEEIDEAMLSGQVVIEACHVAMGTMRLLDAYGFVIFGTGTYNVTFNSTFYTARAGDDYWVASQS